MLGGSMGRARSDTAGSGVGVTWAEQMVLLGWTGCGVLDREAQRTTGPCGWAGAWAPSVLLTWSKMT